VTLTSFKLHHHKQAETLCVASSFRKLNSESMWIGGYVLSLFRKRSVCEVMCLLSCKWICIMRSMRVLLSFLDDDDDKLMNW